MKIVPHTKSKVSTEVSDKLVQIKNNLIKIDYLL